MEPDEFLTGGSYQPMASGPGTEMQPPRAFWGGRPHKGGEEAEPLVGGDGPSPENILGGESFKWDLVTDLDHFFSRLYHYYCNKGFWCIVTQWAVELLTLGFTIVFSGFLILFVNWPWLLQVRFVRCLILRFIRNLLASDFADLVCGVLFAVSCLWYLIYGIDTAFD